MGPFCKLTNAFIPPDLYHIPARTLSELCFNGLLPGAQELAIALQAAGSPILRNVGSGAGGDVVLAPAYQLHRHIQCLGICGIGNDYLYSIS